MQGQTVGGRYQILTQLGQGGFGTTFLAQDKQRPGNPQCVVKLFKPLANDDYTLREAKRLFDLEAATLEILGEHDQIPHLLAHFEENQKFYLVQEYIEGHDLSEEIPPRTNRLSEAEVIKLLKEILEVLTFVHHRHVIHRDIKPANIRRRKSDHKIVLIDFGAVKQISTQLANSQGQTSITVAIGTPGYMPSEQANQVPQFSSDIYAVGIIAIQTLTGINPADFSGFGLPRNPNTGEIDWQENAQISPKLATILDKMVRYDFRQRYPSAQSALQDLEKLGKRQFTNITKTLPSLSSNKIIIFAVISVVIASSIVLFSQFKSNQINLLSYENSNYGVKIQYPESWVRQDLQNVLTKELVTFLSPEQTDTDKFQEKLTISVEDVPSTLDESKNSFIQEIRKNVPNVKILNADETTLANKRANQLVFTGKDGERNFKNLQVWTLSNDKAYIITYTATIEDYDKFLPAAKQMIKSFKIE